MQRIGVIHQKQYAEFFGRREKTERRVQFNRELIAVSSRNKSNHLLITCTSRATFVSLTIRTKCQTFLDSLAQQNKIQNHKRLLGIAAAVATVGNTFMNERIIQCNCKDGCEKIVSIVPQ